MGPAHWAVVLAAFVLLFGASKLPAMARSLGQSARILKTELKGMSDDDAARAQPTEQPAALPPATAGGPAQPQPAESASDAQHPR